MCTDGSAPFTSIQAAIDAAAAGDRITICAGTYTEQLVLADKDVSLQGAGVDRTIVDADNLGRALTVTGNLTRASRISALTLRKGETFDDGGNVYVEGCDGTPQVEFDGTGHHNSTGGTSPSSQWPFHSQAAARGDVNRRADPSEKRPSPVVGPRRS